MSQEFIKELERQKAKQAEQGGFNTPAPVAPIIRPQAPQELSTPEFGPTLASEVQPDAKVPMVGGFEVRGAGAERFPLGTPEVPETLFSTEYTDPGGNTAAIAKIEAERARANAVEPQVSVETPSGFKSEQPAAAATPAEVAASPAGVTPAVAPVMDGSQIPQAGEEGFKFAERGSPQDYFLLNTNDGTTALSPEQITRGQEYAKQQGLNFDPTTGFSQSGKAPQVQAPQGLTTAGGQPLAEFLAGNDAAPSQQLDAQGRMIDPNVDRSSFEKASADREARQAARPDFGAAQTRAAGTVTDRERRAARGDGISDADRRDIAKANRPGASASDIARGDKVAALNGIDRQTGETLKEDGALTDYQKASLALRERELSNSGVKQTAAEAKADLIRQANPDLPEEEIAAITSGSVRVVQNPSTGETTLLNLATGASKKVNTGQETGLKFDVAAPEKTLFSRAGEYTGAVEAAKRKGQGITGQFGVDIATDASIGAAQDFETAQNELVRAFRDSARYSATEANQLKKELNIALSPFEDPKTAEAKLRSIDKSLARRYKNEEAVALDENESIAKREDARSRARAIAQFRSTLGVPEEGAKSAENGNVPANIDAGDWEYMTEEQRKLFN